MKRADQARLTVHDRCGSCLRNLCKAGGSICCTPGAHAYGEVDQAALKQHINEICQTRVRYGYRRVHVLLVREGWPINIKRTYKLYNELGLQLRNKTPKRRVKAKLREDRTEATRCNQTWDPQPRLRDAFSRSGLASRLPSSLALP